MIPLSIFLAFIAFTVWAWKTDAKNERKEYAKCKEEMITWLTEHKSLPRSRVVVQTNGGKTYTTEPFEPEAEVEYFIGGWHVRKSSSEERALRVAEGSIKANRYYHAPDRVFVPMCEIKYIRTTAES